MSLASTFPSVDEAPRSLRGLVPGLSAFCALSAVGGGLELLAWPEGNAYVPISMLEHTPFPTFVVPGLLLGLVVGGTSLAAALLSWRRSRLAVDATLLAGGTMAVWILAEVALMRGFHWLHGFYGALGLALLGLGLHAALLSGLARHRWVIAVTLAEGLGYLAPALTGILAARAGVGELAGAALLTAAGLVEGLLLGSGQALAFPLPVRRERYALLTSLGAGLVWAAVMFLRPLLGSATPLLAVPLGLITGALALLAIGGLQHLELRRHTPTARRWIPWTALAWIAALPLSFAPAPLVDEATPLAVHVALWSSAGLLMAYVMALVTWQGVRRVVPAS